MKSPLKSFCFSNGFLWCITDLALFLSLLVAAYLCPIFLGQCLSSLNYAVPNITFIDFMKSLIYCKICSLILPRICIASANTVSSWGHQTLRKGQTFPFWQEGVLILMVRRLGVGTDFKPCTSAVDSVGIRTLSLSGASPCIKHLRDEYHARPPLWTCIMFQSLWSTLTFHLTPRTAQWGTIIFWMTFLKAIKVTWLAQGPSGAGGAEPRPGTWGGWCQSWLSLSLIRRAGLSQGN